MRRFKQINTSDFNLSRIQDNAATTFSDITKIAFLDGTSIQANLSAGADTVIEHGLGRVPVGYFSTSCSSPGAALFESSTTNNLRDRIILLRATATVTMTIWIF